MTVKLASINHVKWIMFSSLYKLKHDCWQLSDGNRLVFFGTAIYWRLVTKIMTFLSRGHIHIFFWSISVQLKNKKKQNWGSGDFCSGFTIDNLRLQQFNSVNAVTHCSLCCLRVKGQGQCNRYKNTANAHKSLERPSKPDAHSFKYFWTVFWDDNHDWGDQFPLGEVRYGFFSSALAFRSFLLVAGVRTRRGPLQKC